MFHVTGHSTDSKSVFRRNAVRSNVVEPSFRGHFNQRPSFVAKISFTPLTKRGRDILNCSEISTQGS